MRRSLAVVALVGCSMSLALAQVTPNRVRVSEGVMEGLLIHKVRPQFPQDLGPDVQGPVELRAVIDKAGNIEDLQVISGNPMLVPAAMDAVKQRKYRPYLLNGIAVRVETTIHVAYLRLGEGAKEDDAKERASGGDVTAVPIPPDTVQSLIVKRVSPVYPPLARAARIQGTVVVRVIVDKLGNVRETQLISGHPMLAPAAIEAAKQWKFEPYVLNGEIVEMQTELQVNFRLDTEPPTALVPPPPGISGSPVLGPTGGIISGVVGSASPAFNGERVSEAVMRALRIQKIDAIYPPIAVQQGIQGMVVLNVNVNSSGDVEKVTLFSGHPALVPAAMQAVKQWKYIPYAKDGKNVAVATVVRLNFSLNEGDTTGAVNEPTPLEELPRSAVPQRVRVSSGVSQGLLLKKVNPVYPEDARQQYIQGAVVLHVNINKQGDIYNVELVSGHPLLAPAAMEAVRQWEYKPYLLNGQAVEVETTIQVNFRLQ